MCPIQLRIYTFNPVVDDFEYTSYSTNKRRYAKLDHVCRRRCLWSSSSHIQCHSGEQQINNMFNIYIMFAFAKLSHKYSTTLLPSIKRDARLYNSSLSLDGGRSDEDVWRDGSNRLG